MARLAAALALLALLAAGLAAAALASNGDAERFYHSPFYRILSRINGRVYRVGDLVVCPGGCNATIAVRDLAEGVTTVYRGLRGFTMKLHNVTMRIVVEPVMQGLRVNETVVNCYFNASRVELTAPNITRILKPGSHMLYMVKPSRPVVVELDGYRLVVRGFAFIVTPEALRRHEVRTIDNRTVVFGFSTGIVPDATLHADGVDIPIGYAHPYPAVIYALFYNATRTATSATGAHSTPTAAASTSTTLTRGSGAYSGAHGGGVSLLYPVAGAAGVAAAAAAALVAAKRRR